jgi:hypothetical protein
MEEEFRFKAFDVPVEDGKSVSTYVLRKANKRLVNTILGKGYDVPGGLTWKHICENILKDGTNPGTLARVARGQLKSTNGWQVKVFL